MTKINSTLPHKTHKMKNNMITLGSALPDFKKKTVVDIAPGKEFSTWQNDTHQIENKWLVLFWWPKDFTFVCPTEIIEFDNAHAQFQSKNTLLVGASTDTEFVHLAWRLQHPGLKELRMPMLADTNKSLATALGILDEEEGVAYRATLIVDPQGTVRWICVNDMNVGRNVDEVIRVLDALQTGEKTPCNWKKGDLTLG